VSRRAAPPVRVLTLSALAARVARARRRRPHTRIVLANGVFEILHVGHLRYLRAARSLGDMLIVAVNNDRSTRRLRGAGRPIVGDRDRVRLVAGLRCVDAALVFGTPTVAPVLRRLRPDIHCKGTDYSPESVPERHVVLSYGGSVRVVGDAKRHASSDMLATLVRRFGGRAGARRRRSRAAGA
jgi:rfaE bifunctional protein nucleotidyltransferase chain/domain